MKTIKKCLLSLVAIASFSFYSHVSVAQTGSTSEQQPLAEKEWTFLLYLNGHNNLSSYGEMNLKDMEKSGSVDQVNYIVEWGKSGDPVNRRLRVEKSKDPSKVTSPVVMTLQKQDMGDYKNLIEFIRWGVAKYPAKHYFIAVWNHGSGWKRLQQDVHVNDISFDDTTGNKITTEQLGLVMTEAKKIIGHNVDIYGSDACLMQMAEVAAEMKDSVDYFVGSQETEPGEGWPYQTFMQKWGQAPTQTPKEVSTLLSKEYLRAYNGGVYGRKSVTFSALDLSKLDALISSTQALSKYLVSMDATTLAKVKDTATNNVLNFYYSDYADYGDFIKKVSAMGVVKDSRLLSQVQSDIQSLVVTTDNSSSFNAATGLSIWIPSYQTGDMARYSKLQFSQMTGWDKFLQKINAN